MQIPSRKKCYQLIHEMKMLDHIVAHSLQVCQVAIFLTHQFKIQGIQLNHDLVQASALLHDITKTRSFKTKENHALTGEELLSHLGYLEVGKIVGQHVQLNAYFNSEIPAEAEIVNYADKRVLHNEVVLLYDRMNYILQRYGTKPEYRQRIHWLWKKTEQLEERLFNCLPFSPNELDQLLEPEECVSELCVYHRLCEEYAPVEEID
ncbi:MAG: HDIG domain-containing protein [Desulfobacterales bacterium]|nr:HDIG domain-containing protein [Desulfobacterales bacterium]